MGFKDRLRDAFEGRSTDRLDAELESKVEADLKEIDAELTEKLEAKLREDLGDDVVFKRVAVDSEVIRLETDADGFTRENCWFCNKEIAYRAGDEPTDLVSMFMSVMGTKEHFHGVAHRSCAEHSKGAFGS